MPSAPPSFAPVVIIGGGVMGCSVLYHLTKEGVSDAILLERNQISSGTTWHSAAQVRALRASESMTNLIRRSINLYAQLKDETQQSTGWQNTGSLSIACNQGRLTHLHRQEELAKMFGVRTESLSAGEAKERWPMMQTDDVIGATWSPDDGRVSPSDLCAALIKGATTGGARVYEHTAAQGIVTRSGKVAGIETAHGIIRCDAAVLCAGLWSRDIALQANISAPLWPCEHFYLLTQPMDEVQRGMPTLSDHDSHLYIRDESGGLLVGCFEPHGKAIAPERLREFAFQLLPEDWTHFAPMMENALHRIPSLADAEAKTLINGPESFTPDGMFLLGETADTAGLFLGCGMNSVGVASAGGAGFALAQLITKGRLPEALPEADPRRFSACWNSAAALAARAPETLGRHYEISYPGRQPATARNLRLPPLHAVWQKHRARFGQFNGWERPLYFNEATEMSNTSTSNTSNTPSPSNPPLTFSRPAWHEQMCDEVQQAHAQAAVFDLSTLGKIDVSGEDAEAFLNRACTNNMARAPGRVVYSLLLNEFGGIENDLTSLRISNTHYRLSVGTDAVGRTMAHLNRLLRPAEQVVLEDCTEHRAVLAVCGPASAHAVRTAGGKGFELGYFAHADGELAGRRVHIARMSYTGEFGWEITCAPEDASAIYQALQEGGVSPAGLFAQTSMRIEKGFLSYGHDMDSDTTPLDAGLEFAVDWNTPFVGRDALLADKDARRTRRCAAIVFDDSDAVPLGGEPVYADDEIVGRTTSGSFGCRLQKPVALALFGSASALSHRKVEVAIANERFSGNIVSGAPFDSSGARMRVCEGG